MGYFPFTEEQVSLKERAAEVAARALAPRAEQTDRTGTYPQESLDALRDAGFWGLRASKEHGGQGADLLSTLLVVEELAKKCPSTAMCYKMHLEAAELICRVPTDEQVERFVRSLARGEVLATVAGSETWTDGDNWTSTRAVSPMSANEDGYRIENVRKSYVTSAGHATHFFFLCRIGADTPLANVTFSSSIGTRLRPRFWSLGVASASKETRALRSYSTALYRRRIESVVSTLP